MDKRRSKRVPLDVYLNKFINGIPFMVRAKDVSPEGIFLTQLLEPDVDDQRVGIQFQLPGSNEVIYAEGRVMRNMKCGRTVGHGIRFTLITDYHRALIQRYVRRVAAAPRAGTKS
jgi:hypothetical protein